MKSNFYPCTCTEPPCVDLSPFCSPNAPKFASGEIKKRRRKLLVENLKKFGSALKKGIKKVVGKGSRLVSKGAGKLAKRLGEQSRYDWRSNIKGDI